MKVVGRFFDSRENMLLVFLIVFVLVVSCFAPRYSWPPDNLVLILYAVTVLGVVAVAETVVILSGGIDISVGAIVAGSGVLVAAAIRAGIPTPIAIVLGFALGTLLGAFNGALIAFLRIPPIIVTLATLYIYRGLLEILTGARLVPGRMKSLQFISSAEVLSVPMSVIIFLVAAVAVSVFLAHTRLGRMIYAYGGNQAAAEVAGVNVRNLQLFIYAACGFLCGLAGLMFTSRSAFLDRNSEVGIEFIAIAAIVMGGTNIYGGAGKIRGTVIGSILIYAIYNAMVLARVSVTWQSAVVGALILAAVSLDAVLGREAND
jgi:ribose transport system permease protein